MGFFVSASCENEGGRIDLKETYYRNDCARVHCTPLLLPRDCSLFQMLGINSTVKACFLEKVR